MIGGTAGAVAGGVVGNQTGSTTRGAIIGAVVGGAVGAVIGSRMDQQAAEMQAALPGATVERVGEGVQLTFASGLLFDFDADQIKADARADLTKLAESLTKYPDTQMWIVGHTDSEGSDDYNQALSQRRATAAWRFLVAAGVDHGRMQTAGRGEMEPIASNETADGQQANRRIEIGIFASQAARAVEAGR